MWISALRFSLHHYTVRLCSKAAAVFSFSAPHGTLHYLVFQVREIGIAM